MDLPPFMTLINWFLPDQRLISLRWQNFGRVLLSAWSYPGTPLSGLGLPAYSIRINIWPKIHIFVANLQYKFVIFIRTLRRPLRELFQVFFLDGDPTSTKSRSPDSDSESLLKLTILIRYPLHNLIKQPVSIIFLKWVYRYEISYHWQTEHVKGNVDSKAVQQKKITLQVRLGWMSDLLYSSWTYFRMVIRR